MHVSVSFFFKLEGNKYILNPKGHFGDTILLLYSHKSNHRRPKDLGFPGAQNLTGRIENQMRLLIEEIMFNMSSPFPQKPPTTLSPGTYVISYLIFIHQFEK